MKENYSTLHQGNEAWFGMQLGKVQQKLLYIYFSNQQLR